MAINPFAASPILDTQFLKPSTNSELLIPFTVSRPYLNSIKLFPVPLEAVPGILTPFHAYNRWPLPLIPTVCTDIMRPRSCTSVSSLRTSATVTNCVRSS